jgi:hypothetical protein
MLVDAVLATYWKQTGWGGVNVADTPPKERRNPFIYTNKQCKRLRRAVLTHIGDG